MEILAVIKKHLSKIILGIIVLFIIVIGVFRQDIIIHQIDKATGMYYIYKGDKALKKQELQDAISYYRAGLEKYPRHYNAWFNLGNLYVLYEDYFAATDAYNKAIELNNKYMLARMNLGIISAEKIGDFDEAINQYKYVIDTERKGIYIPFVYNSGKSIKLNKAIAYYNMGHAYRQKAIYLPQEDYVQYREYLKKSAEAYENALKINEKDYDTSYNLALVYHLLKEYDKAGRNYCKAIQTDYMSFEAHYNLAILLKHLKFYQEALDEMEKATMLVTSSKTPYSKSMYILAVLNDISTSAFMQANDEEYQNKLRTQKNTENNKNKDKNNNSDISEYNEDDYAIGLTNGKIVINDKLDEIINEKLKKCPENLFVEEED